MSSLGLSQSSQWIPLMDYAMKNGVSLSTLRRHIKSNKITYKIEAGRYLLLDDDAPEAVQPNADLQTTLLKMQAELQHAREEIAELKTLIALYEERIPQPRLDV